MLNADIEGINQVQATLTAAGPQVAAAAGRHLRSTAQQVETTAKQLAPVHTGTLRRSISHRVNNIAGGAEAVVGSDVPYAGYVERGTSRMAPRAYLGPALDRHSGEFVDGIARLAAQTLR